MAEINKSPLDLANQLVEQNAIIGTEVEVPHSKGLKGKITNDIGDTYEVEYTTPNGITRKEQFYKNEYNLPSKEEPQGEIKASTYHPGNGLTNEQERAIIDKLIDLNVEDLNNPKGIRNIIGTDTAIDQIDDAALEELIRVAKYIKNKYPKK